MLRIDRYIMTQFVIGIIPALLLLVALFSFMSLAQELEDVGQGSFTVADALMVVFLTTPRRIVDLLPVSTLLGGLIGLGAMANYRELIAIRTVGISKQRIAQTVAVLALFLCLFIILLQYFVIPGFEHEAATLRAQASTSEAIRAGNSKAIWTRNERNFIRVNNVKSERTLADIEIYTTDEHGRLTQLIQASSALYIEQQKWLLIKVLESRFKDGQVIETRRDNMQWDALLSVDQAAALILPLEALAPSDLLKSISSFRQNQLDTQRYEIVLWQQISLLPSVLAMALMSLPLLLGSVRTVSASQRALTGGLIGIGFYLLQQLSGHLAGILGLNPSLLILTPPVLLMAVAILAIRHHKL
ncbi:MAG: LPS export ABC transporter permease LptG [Lysobacterales bacterium]